ncbi:competence ComEA-like helix-hairpin-helix protein [Gramella sp. Hel_I_59]|uniref:ComEA family DNA-binding protein n=1 Tax=Gramella sp. Hel_I_59 TaxID=1249978 RepID=UPI00114FDB39|nr:helix-hairpin-helix domain-containing protein [Gramella sp. Hel_I_59]TQI70091.1 competence ComEA-like helix-hairpin-helix protein [Gramella sp. Hel_I_59]
MKLLKSHFALSRSQQNGIFVLVLVIIILQLILFGSDYISKDSIPVNDEKLQKFQSQLDSIRKLKPKMKDTIYPFNPNYLSDFKAYQIGLSVEEIDKLLKYRATNKWINSAEDFQRVTGVSDSLMMIIKPSFRFPEWVKNSGKLQKPITGKAEVISIADLNTVSAEDLQVVNGIGEKLSERIVKYRNRIGGFLSEEQLKDVYGLSPEVIARISEKFQVINKPQVILQNINSITEAELAELPYFNPALAKKIINHRTMNEGIRSFEELTKISGFPSDKIDRIKLYLSVQ